MNIRRKTKRIVSTLTLFLVGLLFSASLVSAFSFLGDKLTREDNQGAVEVRGAYLKTGEAADHGVSFQLALNTHSVDLSAYDLKQLSFLQFDESKPIPAQSWEPNGMGHHVRGVVSFNQAVPKGTKKISLLIKGVDNIKERVFEWDLPIK